MLQEHRQLAREAVRKSLVLLKNGEGADKPVLPLPKKAPKILVAGTHADNLGYQCGGWTIEWQGLSGNNLTSGTLDVSSPRTGLVSKFAKPAKANKNLCTEQVPQSSLP